MSSAGEKRKGLRKVWRNRRQIWEGILNSLIRKPKIEKIAKERDKICRSNVCGFYDEVGKGDICYVKGKRCCAACGCNLDWKQRSLSSACGLKELNRYPLWLPVMSEEQEENYRKKTGIKNEVESYTDQK